MIVRMTGTILNNYNSNSSLETLALAKGWTVVTGGDGSNTKTLSYSCISMKRRRALLHYGGYRISTLDAYLSVMQFERRPSSKKRWTGILLPDFFDIQADKGAKHLGAHRSHTINMKGLEPDDRGYVIR